MPRLRCKRGSGRASLGRRGGSQPPVPPEMMGDAPQAPRTWVSSGPLYHPAQLESGPLTVGSVSSATSWACVGWLEGVFGRFGVSGGEEGVAGGAGASGFLLGVEGSALSLQVGPGGPGLLHGFGGWGVQGGWFPPSDVGPRPRRGDQRLPVLPHPCQAGTGPMCAGPGCELPGRRQVLGLSAVSQQLPWDGPDHAVTPLLQGARWAPPRVNWAGTQAADHRSRQGTWAYRACAH